jgi:uncharacterized protein YjiS (DUF1127 family)
MAQATQPNGGGKAAPLIILGQRTLDTMTAHTSRLHLNFELPKMLSYHATWDDADYEPQFPLQRRGPFTRLVAALSARLKVARARRAASSEMAAMSDREFADMGITRCDVTRVLDPEFLPDHQRAHI